MQTKILSISPVPKAHKLIWMPSNRLGSSTFNFVYTAKTNALLSSGSALQVENIEGTNILALSSSNTLSGRAKKFLDILSEEYIEYTKESRLKSSLKTEKFINLQLEELVTIMDSLEMQVDGFKERNEILDLSREQTEFFEALVQLETQERELEFRLEALSSLRNYLGSGLEDNSLPPTSYLIEEDPLLIEQVSQLFEIRNKRASALLDVTEDSYQIRRLDSAISNARFTITKYIEDTREVIGDQRSNVRGQINSLEDRLSGIPATQRDIVVMERKLQVNEKLYVFLLEARAQNVITRASITPQASIIEIARANASSVPTRAGRFTTILFLARLSHLPSHSCVCCFSIDWNSRRSCVKSPNCRLWPDCLTTLKLGSTRLRFSLIPARRSRKPSEVSEPICNTC